MKIEIVSAYKNIHYDRIAIALIHYHELTLRLNIRVTKDRKSLWIEMPQIQRGTFKYHVCKWDSKEISDEFQRTVLEQIKHKFPNALEIPSEEEIKKVIQQKKEAKKNKQSSQSYEEPQLPQLKARKQSKFVTKKA